ncbi:galactoside-binding lectin, partial [Ostertagia ostertagi]
DVVHPDDKKTPLPFSYKVNGQLQPGSVIHIHGKIANPAIRVEFHFLEGFTGASAGQTIFHVSMRFDDPAIVMNSRICCDTLPHTRNFPSGCLQYNQHVIIYGIATGDSWTVELTGSGGNALFQLIAKYKEKVFTRNANIGGNWGQEDVLDNFLINEIVALIFQLRTCPVVSRFSAITLASPCSPIVPEHRLVTILD